MNGLPMVSADDARRFADQVVETANQLASCYIRHGKTVPPPTRLFIEAQCAWTVQLLHHILGGQQLKPEPTITAPTQ